MLIIELRRRFSGHPASVGQTYLEHLRFAWHFGASMVLGGLACTVHGVLPFLFEASGSRRVRALHARLASRHSASLHTGARLVPDDEGLSYSI